MRIKVTSKRSSGNYLKPDGEKRFTLLLKKSGEPSLSILLSNNADTLELEAGNVLCRVLSNAAGCEYAIVFEGNMDIRGDKPFISIGNTELYREYIGAQKLDLQEDGYSISSDGVNLFLNGGSTRGPISAVIALLEEDLGSRFYTVDEGLIVPELSDKIEIILRDYFPRFKVRTMFQSESFSMDYQLFNRVGALREKFDYVPECFGGSTTLPEKYFVHTLQNFLSNEEYFENHPEYFALIDGERRKQGHGDILGGIGGGQLCFTHPDVRKIVAKNVLKELGKYHSFGIFDVSENDVVKNSFCQCETCRKMKEKEGSDSGALIDFINYIADEVAKVYPGVKISTLAYVESSRPPKNIRPNKNVLIRLANKSGLYPYPILYAQDAGEFYSNLLAWVDAGAQLIIWEYAANYLSWLLPRPNFKVIDNDINLFAEKGIYGLFLQSSHRGPGENQGKMRAWVYSKKMWNPALKIEDLIRDFNYGYFGKAASFMQEYSDLLQNEWNMFYAEEKNRGRVFEFSSNFYPKALLLFKAALESSSDDPDLFRKVEFEFINILFYRLEKIKPENNRDDVENYKDDLSEFIRLTKKYHVVSISENNITVSERIEEWKKELAAL